MRAAIDCCAHRLHIRANTTKIKRHTDGFEKYPRCVRKRHKSVRSDGLSVVTLELAAQGKHERPGIVAILGDVVLEKIVEERRHPEPDDLRVANFIAST